MPRILYITQNYCTHDRRFLEQISAAGYEIFFVPCEPTSREGEPHQTLSRIRFLPPLSRVKVIPGEAAWIAAAHRFRRLILEISPDLVHAGPLQTGGFIAALTGFHPLVMMSWGSDVLLLPERSSWLSRITQFALKSADIAIADCDAVQQRITALAGIDGSRIVTLPWGVDLKLFRPKISALQLRTRLRWNKCKILISTRAFESIYGTMTFLRAVKQVLTRADDVRVLMLGDGSLRTAVEQFVARNGLAEKMHFSGFVQEEELPDYFAEADLYASASYCDGSSVSLLEAMGCGLPVIVCNSYGNSEWVSHGENGWLCSAGDADGLAQCILQALNDDVRRFVAGRANVQIVRDRADWNVNFARVLQAYDELLEGKSFRSSTDAQLQNR